MEKFKSFITEQKTDKYRILVISAEPNSGKLFHTAQRISDEAKKSGHDVYVVKVEGAIISVEIAQPSSGGPYTVAWNTIFEFAASTAPTMTATASKTDIFSFRYKGSIWQEIGRVQNLAQT